MIAAISVSSLAASVVASAAEEDDLFRAAERVADLYAVHEQTVGQGGDKLIAGEELQFFHPLTAAAMQASQLAFDPIFAGGERPITEIEIFPDTETGIVQGAGFVRVLFKANNEPRQLRYSLLKLEEADKEAGTWWIVDIEGDDWSLKRMLLGR